MEPEKSEPAAEGGQSPSRRTLLRRAVPIIAVGLGAGTAGAAATHAATGAPGIPGGGLAAAPSDEDIARLVADPSSATHRALAELLRPAASDSRAAGLPAPDNGRADPRKAGADVVLLVGQSNMQGAGLPYDPALDIGFDGVEQFAGSGPHAGKVLPAEDSLFHVTQYLFGGSPAVGPGMEFGRQLWLHQEADRKVLLVPAARGGTGFTGNADYSWDPDNKAAAVNLARRAADACARALALNPAHRLAAILWHQGEADAMAGADERWYRRKLLQLVDLFRAEFGPVPFLAGGMVPEWVAGSPSARGIDRVHRSIASERPLAAFVEGPQGAATAGDIIHYDAAGARELGLRYFRAYGKLTGGLS
ncbi:sialate O-acetylesterase [Arthrobacter mangrovi]|uniref:Acetylxylan esterase n=1 Tax=Arthrobacter mangrovi TaxID=2966350 RepID=A0ABQ5MQG1_9MICC|nr:sialate O-acetylesterase [Arthrobacter mangrovi]GLB66234.1 acetylxylan esterase [Arthrobacter mangrovi]